MRQFYFISAIVCTTTLPGLGGATAEPSASKASKADFTLFQPTPVGLLRDFDPDRPDKTNSPRTLDAGHFQLEMDLAAFSRSKAAGVTSENWNVANTNLRVGLLNWADLEFMVPCYQAQRVNDAATAQTDRTSGTGDLTIALKMNAWGNDEGDTAGGVELAVKTPTAGHGLSNGKTEGSLVALFDTKLPGDFDLGFNTGVGISANDDGGYHTDIINSVSVSHDLVGPVSAYLEFFSSVPSNQSHDWEGTVDFGLLLMVGKNLQLDAGVNLGVTSAADDVQTFVGVTVRF